LFFVISWTAVFCHNLVSGVNFCFGVEYGFYDSYYEEWMKQEAHIQTGINL
jgi:hypothetical protein